MQIITDTREKTPWIFSDKVCAKVLSRKLETGDYSIEGMEHLLCIERKRTVAEIALNVFEPRFKVELERMQKYKYRFMIMEFDMDDIRKFPVGSDIPKSRWAGLKVGSPYILKFISEMHVHYDVHVIYAGDRDNAIYVATNIMKRVYDKHRED